MERVFRWIYDAVMLGCIVITTIFTYLVLGSTGVTACDSGWVARSLGWSMLWWVFVNRYYWGCSPYC